jgi:hypothetical protein
MFSTMATSSDNKTAKVPVLLLAFNRPAATKKVLDAITAYQPPHLYVAVDGPRVNNIHDAENCKQVIEIIDNWEKGNQYTLVHRLFQKTNLGCGIAVSTAISWFFNKEEMGIILEDDCLPNSSFFFFCQALLHKYYEVEQVMHIGGSNFLYDSIKIDGSYYFSKYPHIWGWASWKRAWNKYEYSMPLFDEFIKLPDFIRYYDAQIFIKTKFREIDTWDSQWIYSFLMNNGLSILPTKSMITNIGFNKESGSHINKKPKWYKSKIYSIETLIHPVDIVHNEKADDYVFNKIFKRGVYFRLKKNIRKLFFKKSYFII